MTILERPPWPVTDRAALAALVAHPTDPHARALDTENRNAGRLPGIAEADDLGAPYVVNVAPDVLALDIDATEAGDPDAFTAAAEALADQLDADGWPVLRVTSGRPGHWHLWAVIADPDALDRAKFDATVAGIPPRAVMRPPGSPHRLGLPVRVLDDPDAFTAAAKAARIAEAADRATVDRDRFDWRRILATGKLPASLDAVPAGCGPGWWRVWWIAVGAARAGLTVDQLRAELAKPANLGGGAYRRRLTRHATGHADHWLDAYVWPKATQVARKRPTTPADATEARRQLAAIRAAVDAHPWRGIAGTTDRAVLVALLDRAHARGSLTPAMSHRELAEAAPCHRNTAKAATDRLRAAGWLLVAERGRGTTDTAPDGTYRERANATRWRLRLPAELRARACATEGTPPARTSLSGTSARARLDACRWRGLGLNAPRVLDALAAVGPMTSRGLADRLGLSWGNLRARLLPRMAGLGLLVRAGDAYALADDLDAALAGAAVTLGLNGKADEVAAKHTAERAGYLEHRERTRPDRERARRRTMAAKRTAKGTATSSTAPTLPLDVPVAPVPSSEPMTGPHPPPDPLDAPPGALAGLGSAGRDR